MPPPNRPRLAVRPARCRTPIAEWDLSRPSPTGGDFGHTQLVWVKGWLVLIQAQVSAPQPERDRLSPRGYVIDPKTGEVVSSAELRPH